MGNEPKKRKKSVTKASMSVTWFRNRGYVCESTEQTIRYPDKFLPGKMKVFKRDLFNAFDGVAVSTTEPYEVVFFQATVGMNNKCERIKKIEDSSATLPLLRAGTNIELHVWRKMGARGARKLWKVARFKAIPDYVSGGNKPIWDSCDNDVDIPQQELSDSLF